MKSYKGLISLILLFAATGCFIETVNRELAGDDLMYSFIFDDTRLYDAAALQPIESFADVVRSQKWHYNNFNGRLPVHVAVQTFSGLWGNKAFAIVNSLIYVGFLILLVTCAASEPWRKSPWTWLLFALAVYFAFPGGINVGMGPWFGIAMGVNYLWAGALFLLCLRAFRGNWPLIPAVLVAFLAGWSNEAFSVPLSGAVFFYGLIYKKWRSGKYVLTALALWIGTALIAFAPGTLDRASIFAEEGPVGLFVSLLECYSGVIFFWLFLLTVLALLIAGRLSVKDFIKSNLMICLVWGVAVLFSLFAHTEPHSLTCIELMSLVLIFRLLCYCGFKPVADNRLSRVALFAVMSVAAVFQGAVMKANSRAMEEYRAVASRFVASPDGVVWSDYPQEHPLVKPFLDPYIGRFSPAMNWCAPFAVHNGVRNRVPLELSPADYRALIVNPDSFFVPANRIPGNAGLYRGENFFFKPCGENDGPAPVLYECFGSDFADDMFPAGCLFCRLFWKKKSPIAIKGYRVQTRKGDYFIYLPTMFRVKSVVEGEGLAEAVGEHDLEFGRGEDFD